jgi:hypothetical protein
MMLATRKEQYHMAAVKANSENNKMEAAKMLRTSKVDKCFTLWQNMLSVYCD